MHVFLVLEVGDVRGADDEAAAVGGHAHEGHGGGSPLEEGVVDPARQGGPRESRVHANGNSVSTRRLESALQFMREPLVAQLRLDVRPEGTVLVLRLAQEDIVVNAVRLARGVGALRTDRHDTAPRRRGDEVVQHVYEVEVAHDVAEHLRLDVGVLRAARRDRLVVDVHDARVQDHAVHARNAEVGERGREGVDRVQLGRVEAHNRTAAGTLGADVGRERLGLFQVAARHDDVCAFGRQLLRRSKPRAGAGASDDDGFARLVGDVVECESHDVG